MSCRLIKKIKHSCAYNPGGITEIYLLHINDFTSYLFKKNQPREECEENQIPTENSLFDSCYIDRVFKEKDTEYILLDTVDESSFSESNDNGLFKQELTTFVHSLRHFKTANVLIASKNRYVVFFRTRQGNVYSYGSDGGAAFSFTQISGKTGEASGYNITLSKNSIYPLFEVDAEKFNKLLVLGTEKRVVVCTENKKNAILI